MTDGSALAARRYTIRGRVQGVAFRWFTRRTAERLGVTGWVRNRRDGSVEAAAAGSPAVLDAFREALRQGPPAARVDGIDEEAIEPGPWTDFTIRPTA
ncbi:MAG: acylphosphatase [Acidobacteria bacterium]|nr:MAG: acylphosphatase [Acidobacteriota bacterium]